MPLLTDLLTALPIAANVEGNAQVKIEVVTTDSRRVVPGALYVAVRGTTQDGHAFVPEALAKGAAAVMVDNEAVELPAGKVVVRVENTREALAHVAAAFYPEQPAHMVAVTGTDGKTSTAEFTRQLAAAMGLKAASIGTLGLSCDDAALKGKYAASHTSPDPLTLHQMLADVARTGVDVVAMEASSHGIHQHRIDAVRLGAAAFTNLTRDHLDYHGTVEAYAEAKLRLFSDVLAEGKTMVVNEDDALAVRIEGIARARGARYVSYGEKGRDFQIRSILAHANGLDAQIDVRGVACTLSTPLFGAFQIYNMLAAVGLCESMGHDARDLIAACAHLSNVRGRMEKVATHPSGAGIFIDYAHTPAALEKVLQVARAHIAGKLHVVFGCGGDRDTGKRPLMGEVAARCADVVIVTDDNPRSENAASIRASILAACPGAREIGDRAEAIAAAMENLQPHDALIVAGKGHETTQIIGEQVLNFNDAEAIREAVARL